MIFIDSTNARSYETAGSQNPQSKQSSDEWSGWKRVAHTKCWQTSQKLERN